MEQDRASHARSACGGRTRCVVGSAVGTQAGRLLQARDVAGERHLRGGRRHGADRVADHEFAPDQVGVAHHGVGGVEHFGQPGPRAPAQRRECVGQPRAGDQVVGRCPEPGAPQQAGDLDEEPRHARRAGMFEHVAVPAGARHAGGVARRRAQPAMGPRHPRRGDLHLGEPAEDRGVAAVAGVDRRRVSSAGTCQAPQTTTIGPVDVLDGRRGWRDACAPRVGVSRRDGTKPVRTAAIASATASNAAGPSPRCSMTSSHQRSGSGSPAAAARSRSGSGGVCSPTSSSSLAVRRRRSVTASGRSMARTSTPCSFAHRDRLPLGAEHAERREHRARRIGDRVAEQRHRRHEPVVADPPQRRSRSAGSSTRTMSGCIASSARRTDAGRSGAVMADTEQVQVRGQMHLRSCARRPSRRDAHSSSACRRRRSHPNRRGRARPSRGTPARRPCRAPGR